VRLVAGRQSKVYVLDLAGQQQDALAFARRRYPVCEAVILSKTERARAA